MAEEALTTQEQGNLQELNEDRFDSNAEQSSYGRDKSNQHSPNMALGIIMLILAIVGLMPGIGVAVRGTLKLLQKMGHYPKNNKKIISKLPGNIPTVISMFFTK